MKIAGMMLGALVLGSNLFRVGSQTQEQQKRIEEALVCTMCTEQACIKARETCIKVNCSEEQEPEKIEASALYFPNPKETIMVKVRCCKDPNSCTAQVLNNTQLNRGLEPRQSKSRPWGSQIRDSLYPDRCETIAELLRLGALWITPLLYLLYLARQIVQCCECEDYSPTGDAELMIHILRFLRLTVLCLGVLIGCYYNASTVESLGFMALSETVLLCAGPLVGLLFEEYTSIAEFLRLTLFYADLPGLKSLLSVSLYASLVTLPLDLFFSFWVSVALVWLLVRLVFVVWLMARPSCQRIVRYNNDGVK